MKKVLLICSLIVLGTSLSFGQAKKPVLMIIPADDWMQANGFMTEVDNQGVKEFVPDYNSAFVKYPQLNDVIANIDGVMLERDFPTVRLKETLDQIKMNAAEDMLTQSKDDGSGMQENALDILANTAKADIWMKVSWTITTLGPKKSVSFRLEGIDSYSRKAVASEQGEGAPSFSASEGTLLKEAVTANMDNFCADLMTSFQKWFDNGREVSLRIKTWDSWDGDLESEDYGDDELNYLIELWLEENTVGGRFGSPNPSTATQMMVNGCMIPMFNDRGRAMDAKGWARGLSKYLKEIGIPNKLQGKGLGAAQIILGGK